MDQQAYLRRAEQAGLPEIFATLSWQWAQAHPVSPALQQHPSDLVDAFRTARQLHPFFCTLVEQVAKDTQGAGFTRPGRGVVESLRSAQKSRVGR